MAVATGRKVELIPIAKIGVSKDRLPINKDVVKRLAASIKDVGQLQPIAVDAEFVLIYGNHRVEAQKLNGSDYVEGYILDVEDLAAGIMEIDENFVRNTEITALQRADALARRKALYERLHPEAKRTANVQKRYQRPEDSGSNAPSFATATAEATGLSERTVMADVRISEQTSDPEVRDLLIEAGLDDNRAALREVAATVPVKGAPNRDATPTEQKKRITQIAKTREKKAAAKTVVDVLDPHAPEAPDVIAPHVYVASIVEQIMSLPDDMDTVVASLRQYGLAAHPNLTKLEDAANKFSVLVQYITALGGLS